MNKKLVAALFLAISAWSFGQNDPTIDNVYIEGGNNFCADGSYKNLIVVATDIDGDVISVDSIVFTNGFLQYSSGPAPVVVGNTTTFTFYVEESWTTPPGVGAIETDIAEISISSASGLDPTSADAATLPGLVVNGPVFVEFVNPFIEVCSNGLPIDLSQHVNPAGGQFSWNYNYTPYEASNSNSFDPQKAYNYYVADGMDGYTIYYTMYNVNACKTDAIANVVFYDPPTVNFSIAPSTCLNADGSVMASVSMGTFPYDVYWSTGFSETDISAVTQITNLSSGVYYLNVTDNMGCKTVGKANVSDADIVVTPTIDNVTCAGVPGSIELAVSAPGTVSEMHWSNGQNGTILTSGPGEYSIAIHTDGNCNFFGTYEIQDLALKVKLDNLFPNSNCFSGPTGAFYITTTGGDGLYTWDWKLNGVSVYNGEDLLSAPGGLYTCTVQDGSGCSVTWSKTLENYTNVWLWAQEVVSPTCGNSDGAIDIYIDPFGDTPATYEWSNAATSEDLTGLSAGVYTLTYTDQAGCENYLTIKLVNQRPYQPSICLLTVDTSLIYNQVVWEKDITQNVTGFNIYRETSVFGEFELVAQRPYALESFYQDNDASPVDRSWRYKITTIDGCGGESYGSFIHKTIHVVSNTTNGTDFTVTWDNYEGISYSTIDLHRYDQVNGWVTIGADLPYGSNTFPDTPPVLAGLDYMVTFNLIDPCTSTKAQDHNSSRSNKTSAIFNPGGSTALIADQDLGIVSIYPNPANEMITLHVDRPELFQYYEITDLNGKVVATGTISENNTAISLEAINSGVYMIRLVSESQVVVNKFVKS